MKKKSLYYKKADCCGFVWTVYNTNIEIKNENCFQALDNQSTIIRLVVLSSDGRKLVMKSRDICDQSGQGSGNTPQYFYTSLLKLGFSI